MTAAVEEGPVLIAVPKDFFKAHPLPALEVCLDGDRVRVSWSNTKWSDVSEGRPLDKLLGQAGIDQLRYDLKVRDLGVAEICVVSMTLEGREGSLRFAKTQMGHNSWMLTSLDPADATKCPHKPGRHSTPSNGPERRMPRAQSQSHDRAASTPSPLRGRSPFPKSDTVGQSIGGPPRPPRPLGPPGLDCRRLLDGTDWSLTSLGPRKMWSPVVEMMIDVVMRSPTQDALWLGTEFNMIYNQNYAQIVHHPTMFGTSAMVKDAWGPVWQDVLPTINRCLQLGESCHFQDDLLLYRRGPTGHFVEKYHTWSFVPLFDQAGRPLGLYNPTVETTASVLARRRHDTLRDLSEMASAARSSAELFDGVAKAMEPNAIDVPFVAFYTVSPSRQDPNMVDLHLESSVGLPDSHPAAPHDMSLVLPVTRTPSSPTLSELSLSSAGSGRIRHSDQRNAWPIGEALNTRQCTVMDDCSFLVKGIPLRHWDHLPESAIVVPISSDRSMTATPDAVMVLGLNLQCPLDGAYQEWIQVLRAHITSALASAKNVELAEHRRLEQERMARAQSAWFQGAAHDLRSPLTLVAGPLDDVLRTELSAAQRNSLTLASRSVARIQRLVNALLDFSRIEAGKLTGHFTALDLGAFVTDIANLFAPAITRKGIELVADVAASDQLVWVDPTLMETVVTNLLSNAFKYTLAGTITVSVLYRRDQVEIAISDTGCGIPEQELQGITSRFTRASTALQAGVEGTGIGLALTQELVRIHQGTLAIQSQVDGGDGVHGSTFTVRIPLIERHGDGAVVSQHDLGSYGRQLALEAMHSATADLESQPTGSGSEPGSSSSGDVFLFGADDTILLVDDNAEIRRYISQLCSPFCRVVEATDGKHALQFVKTMSPPPDLVLSDVMMPGISGVELLAAIRDSSSISSIPVVLLSAATDEDLRLSALTGGADDFVLKPFKPKELLARVHLHMQLGKRRRYLENVFAQREHEIKLLSDYCPSGIVRADEHGNLIYANRAFRDCSGLLDEEELADWTRHVDEPTHERLSTWWDKVVHNDGQQEYAATWTWLNGKTVTAHFIRLDLAGVPGSKGILGCLQDISHQQERLREAEQRRIEAEEARRQQELLVDMTSHEIRTPVSAILQCSSLVRDNLVELRGVLAAGLVGPDRLNEIDKDIDALESIYQCGLVQERIAGDILSLARIQLDSLSLHFTPTSIEQEAQKIIAAFSAEARMKSIHMGLDFGPSFDKLGVASVYTDHVRLRQVVTNLVTNAIRFTATSTTRRITIRYDVASVPPRSESSCAAPAEPYNSARSVSLRDGDPLWLFIGVSDTGPGLTPEECSILFQRFTQGNKMIHSQYGGSGLGLYICRKISELLGGRIEVESRVGVGSTFRFYIQTTYASTANVDWPAPAAPEIRPTLHRLVTTRRVVVDPDVAKSDANLRILIVEDNVINQTVLKRQLDKTGWRSDVANHGLEAIEKLSAVGKASHAAPYDAILMDLEMPVMDGLTALRRIREMEAEGVIPRQLVIALTGNAREGQIQQALEAGMDDVVIKPYKLPELVSKLRAVLGTS